MKEAGTRQETKKTPILHVPFLQEQTIQDCLDGRIIFMRRTKGSIHHQVLEMLQPSATS